MQCIRIKRGHSSASSSSSLSVESINKYFERNSSRKSFLRRSFDLVRKNVVRRSEHSSHKGSKTEKNVGGSWFDGGDQNNNRNSQSTVFSTSTEEYTYDGDILSFSTDCDILTQKINPDRQSRER